MRLVRITIVIIILILLILLGWFLSQNPLFLKDMALAIHDIGLELTLTGLLVMGLLWLGIEINYYSTKPLPRKAVLPGSGLITPDVASSSRDFWQGISTEMIGAAISTILLGMLVLIFQQYQAIQNHKNDLILQMSSPADRGSAIEAVHQLRAEGRLLDGTLQGANLWRANLQDTYLGGANLRGAYLWDSTLQGANLEDANLRDAVMLFANLQDANLQNADLQGTYLYNANLRNVNLKGVNFDEETVLPDAEAIHDEIDDYVYMRKVIGHPTPT